MRPRFDCGQGVRVTRNVRNDGTYPGLPTGALLVREGSTGYVQHIGTFLQDQVIYAVHFLDDDRLIGCREAELLSCEVPWAPCRFPIGGRVLARLTLAVHGEVKAQAGAPGEVRKVLRNQSGETAYHVAFAGCVLEVPEEALRPNVETESSGGLEVTRTSPHEEVHDGRGR